VFREVKRVLRNDGTVWLNLGDSYYNYRPGVGQALVKQSCASNQQDLPQTCARRANKLDGLKEKDLVGIPWMVAFALRSDGWYLRQDIIWHKPSPMPESVVDRCTKSHEYIFLLTKSKNYFYDNMAIMEDAVGKPSGERVEGGTKRNRRSVWTIATKPYKGAHFATFTPELPSICIQAGCPEKVCSKCGAPWKRVVEKTPATSKLCPKTQSAHEARGGTGEPTGTVGKSGSGRIDGYVKTIGFEPTCECNAETSRGVVLDPFGGSGTTAEVATNLNRDAILIELNPKYVEMAKERTAQGNLFEDAGGGVG
jgi:DNA modification methylase